jgi:2-polyprenyl-6-methoxyphenol hydroxylase-like FAD-dependent oxidoreductase
MVRDGKRHKHRFDGTSSWLPLKDKSMRTTTDILIAGAGPVGLLLATELWRDGADVLLIDPMMERTFFCKALGVTPRTLEIFDDLGFVQDAIDAGIWLRGVSSFNDGAPSAIMDMPADLPYGSLSLAQFETERLLENCLRRHGGKVSYGWTLTGFEAHADGVRAQIEGPGADEQTIDCRWLVGCDGAHSKVRSALHLNFEGDRYPQTFVLADLEVEWNLPRGRFYRFNHGVTAEHGSTSLVAVPVHGSGRRYRLSTIVPDSAANPKDVAVGEGAPPTLAEVTALMGSLLPPGTVLSSLHWSSVYRISHRIVPTYAQGRVFLAGDGAHLHPPVGGQGMNTGLQDAHNLAWKLTLASRDLATQGLLDSYSAERHPVGQDVVRNTSRALNDVLAQRAQLPGMRETQLLISYRDSAIVKDERPDAAAALLAAGDRVPDAGQLRRSFVAQPFRLHERLGRGRHILIGYISVSDETARADTLAKMLSLLRAVMGEAANGFAVTPAGCILAEREDLPMVVDGGGEFAAAFSAQPGMAWLVRPDGYIGWCSKSPSIDSLRSFLKLIVSTSIA